MAGAPIPSGASPIPAIEPPSFFFAESPAGPGDLRATGAQGGCQVCNWIFNARQPPIGWDGCSCCTGDACDPSNPPCEIFTAPCYGAIGKTAGGQVGNVTTIPVPYTAQEWADAWSAGENIDSQGRTFGVGTASLGWQQIERAVCPDDFSCAAPTLSRNVAPSLNCPPGTYYDVPLEACIQIPTSPLCPLPCWLSCAPGWLQAAYCAFVAYVIHTCTWTGLASCLAKLATDEFDPTGTALCITEILGSCTSSVVVQAGNLIISWLGLNPFGCPGCTPSPSPKCRDGSTPTAPPCRKGMCFEGSPVSGCCPCDPPLPYGGAGPLTESGTQFSTESYWSAAPTPLGMALPAPVEIDEAAALTPTVPRIIAPIMIPLPTAGIAVTACSSCANDDDEIDEL